MEEERGPLRIRELQKSLTIVCLLNTLYTVVAGAKLTMYPFDDMHWPKLIGLFYINLLLRAVEYGVIHPPSFVLRALEFLYFPDGWRLRLRATPPHVTEAAFRILLSMCFAWSLSLYL